MLDLTRKKKTKAKQSKEIKKKKKSEKNCDEDGKVLYKLMKTFLHGNG